MKSKMVFPRKAAAAAGRNAAVNLRYWLVSIPLRGNGAAIAARGIREGVIMLTVRIRRWCF